MATKLKHLRSGVTGVAPTDLQIEVGQIAINYNDEYLFIKNVNDDVIVIASAASVTRSNNSITTINGKNPDAAGAVTLNPEDIGANGVAYLDGTNHIPIALLPESVIGGVTYQGTWDAATNTPTLPDATTVKGHYYVTSVAGTFNSIDFQVGDWAISNGVEWQKVDALDSVTSVAGRTGAVVLTAADIASGIFDSARLGSTPGNNLVLTTDATGNPKWVSKSEVGEGTVTSVNMTVPPALLAVIGGPITSNGTFAVTLPNRAANLVFAGPATGADAAPAFRALVQDDIPDLDEGTF